MRTFAALQSRVIPASSARCVMLSASLLAAALSSVYGAAQSASQPAGSPTTSKSQQANAHHSHARSKKQEPPPVAQAPPPMPNWPVNDKPNPASVVWDANGLRINASNSSLQQILNEVSTETGTKVEGMGADQRIYGVYGPGKARDVISQLLQGSGYNILLAGDIGQGAPREIVLSPRQSGPAGAPGGMNRQQQDPDEDIPDQPEEQQQPIQPPPQSQAPMRPGFGPNGPIRTPQQVMEEMQQRQLQQQQQQGAPQPNPQ
ncbi:MAG: hypothetical protein WA354_15720 [Terracidiphilus sp.]